MLGMHRFRYQYRYWARYQAHVLVLVKMPPIPKTDTSRDVTDRIFRAQRHRRQQQKQCQPQGCGNTSKLMMTTHTLRTACFQSQFVID